MIQKFRKKPVVIEAVQLTEDNVFDVAGWAHAEWYESPARLEITTLEGVMEALAGDWIIRGVRGEFYPCKPDIFALTYEEA